jgi:hypothetical protein
VSPVISSAQAIVAGVMSSPPATLAQSTPGSSEDPRPIAEK